MNKSFKIATLLLFTLITAITGQQVVDGVAAIVGSDIVLISEINGLITQYAFQNKIDISRQPELYQKLGKKFLKSLIDERLLLIKAEEDTIKADEERVEQTLKQQIDYFTSQAGSVEKLEEYYSAPLFKIKKDLREKIRNQMMIGILREKKLADIKVTRKEIEDFYKQYQDSLPRMKASVEISHILMQVTPSENSIETAFQKVKQIKEELKTGGDFATLARKYSEDPGSAQNGGDLGFVSRGTLVKEFEEVAFALDEKEISDIVQTQFGFHIIQLLERQGEKIHPRHILIQLQPTQEDEKRVIDKLMQIREDILSDTFTFEEMALKYSDDPNVDKDRGNLGEFEAEGFQIKEFGEAVKYLEEGEISTPFKTEFGYHIVQLNKRKEARTLSLKNDWAQIEGWAIQYKQDEEFKSWLAKLRDEIPVVIQIEI